MNTKVKDYDQDLAHKTESSKDNVIQDGSRCSCKSSWQK
jgi:hypothetical protein